MSIILSETLLAGILAAQVVQIGFEASLLNRQSTLETKVAERTEARRDV